jgi:anaerobic selenocysteine-containing dehydrogenase
MTAWTADPPNNVPEKPQYIHGLMCWGQNPAVGGASCDFERKAMENLDWLVCVDLWETETAAFWKRPGANPATINTTVYLLPAAASYEKEGSITNSGRWSQWRYKAAPPPGQAMDDLSILNELGKRLITMYQGAAIPLTKKEPVANLWWGPYCNPATSNQDAWGMDGSKYDDGVVDARTGLLEANPHKVAKEINGYFCTNAGANIGKRVDGFWGNWAGSAHTLLEDGKTSSGNWLYCSHYVNPNDPLQPYELVLTTPDGNRQANRDPVDVARGVGNQIGLFSRWSICWPINRRIIYNGASVYQTGHPQMGQPLAPQKWVVAWDALGTAERKPGGDVPDGFTPPGSAGARYPFIMQNEGHARLFGPGREDGPFPEHYEPWETVMTEHAFETIAGENPHVMTSPTLFAHARPEAYEHPGNGNPDFPIVGTTYRVTEHWQAGAMTRNNPWLCQLQPNAFVELSEELANAFPNAADRIQNGDMVEIKTQRTDLYGTTMQAVACVTKRFKPFTIRVDGSDQTVHHIGVIWHYGYTGCCTGDSANLLTPHIGDANTGIPESKAFICNIRKLGGNWL